MIHPPGSSPGMIAFAIAPASRPKTMNAMIPIAALPLDWYAWIP
jgi:hypothetical protein